MIVGMPVFAYDEVTLGNIEAQKIEIPKNDVKLKTSLIVTDEQIMQELIKMQREKDLEDIENLR